MNKDVDWNAADLGYPNILNDTNLEQLTQQKLNLTKLTLDDASHICSPNPESNAYT